MIDVATLEELREMWLDGCSEKTTSTQSLRMEKVT
jgi:hypothetical protein